MDKTLSFFALKAIGFTREPEWFRAGRAAEAYDEGPEEWDGEEPLEEEDQEGRNRSSEEGDNGTPARYQVRQRFWSGLNEYLRATFPDLPEVESRASASIRVPSDVQHIGFELYFGLRDSYVDIDVCFWREPSFRVWESIKAAPGGWNNLIGGTWDFEGSPERQRGYMSVWREIPNLRNELSWPEAYSWMSERLSALYEKVAPRLREEMDQVRGE